MDATTLWRRLERYAATHMPPERGFNPPASAIDLADLAAAVAAPLPPLLPELLRVHDGCAAPVLPQGAWMRSAAEMVTAFRALGALAEENFADWPPTLVEAGTHVDAPFHPAWVPFATRDDFELFIDLAPGPAGCVGQVLFQTNEASVAVVGQSLGEFMDAWASLLEGARLRYEPDYGYPVPADGASFESLFAVGAAARRL